MSSMLKKDGAPLWLVLPFVGGFWALVIWAFVTGNWGWAALIFIATVVGFGLLVQLVAPAAVSDSSPIRSNTAPISTAIVIGKPAGAVWSMLARAENWRDWWPSGIARITPGWTKGATVTWDQGGTSTLSKCRPQREIRIVSPSIETRIILSDQGGSTQVVLQETPINGVRWTDGGFSRLRPMTEALERLKACVLAQERE